MELNFIDARDLSIERREFRYSHIQDSKNGRIAVFVKGNKVQCVDTDTLININKIINKENIFESHELEAFKEAHNAFNRIFN